MTVAIAVDTEFHDVFGQHLDHADFARPCALRGHRVEIAVPVKLQRGKDMRAEQFGAAAVMGQCDQRIERVVIALKGAEIGLEGPEGQQDASAYAEPPFGFVKDGVEALTIASSCIKPVLADETPREFDEGLREKSLTPVGIQRALVEPGAAEKAIDRALIEPALHRFRPKALHELAKISAALLGAGGTGGQGQGKGCGGKKTLHGE